MKIINNIVVFDNDKFFIGLLKGYCYTKGISIVDLDFDINKITEIEHLKPDLVFFSMDLLEEEKDILHELLSTLTKTDGQAIVCGLKNNKSHSAYGNMPDWIDAVINNPIDIGEIDRFIKNKFLLNIFSAGDRRHLERRSFKERRGDSLINMTGTTGQHEIESFDINDFKIDQRNKRVFLNGQKVDLTRKEYELLELLSSDFNRVYTAEEIINHLWPDNNRATKSDLYQYMHLLRKKIEKDPNHPQWIMTIKGFGYKLNAHDPDKTHQDELYY